MSSINSAKVAPVVRLSLRHQTLSALRDAVINGVLKPGERLRESELSAITGVSRTVIREVFRQLESEGLIATIPNKGAVVKTLSAREAEDIYRIRARLEGLAARLFVENASDERLRRLSAAGRSVIDSYSTQSVHEILKAKDRFYDVLYKGTNSDVLCRTLSGLNAQIARWRAICLWHPSDKQGKAEKSIRDMKAIVSAIQHRDADLAESLVCKHVLSASKAVNIALQKESAEARTNVTNLKGLNSRPLLHTGAAGEKDRY